MKEIKYAPQMTNHRLRKSNMTTITMANLGKAIGDINRFFAHDNVYKLTGFRYEVIGTEPVKLPDEQVVYHREIEGDRQEPIYYPIPSAYCRYHALWMKHLKGEFCSMTEEDCPRLSISSIYQPHCNPIGLGYRYKIFGNRLIIYAPYDKYIHKTPWLRYSEYIQVPEVDKEKYLQAQINGLHKALYDEMYYDYEMMAGRISDDSRKNKMHEILCRFSDQVSDFVASETRNHGNVNKWQYLTLTEDNKHKVTFRYNPYLFLKYGLEGKYDTFKYLDYNPEDPDDMSTSLIHSTLRAYQDLIDQWNESYQEDHQGQEEYFGDPFDDIW